MDAVYGGDINEQRIKAKTARLMRRRRLMTQRNDPLMNQRFLEIEREARRLGSAYLRLRRLPRAPSRSRMTAIMQMLMSSPLEDNLSIFHYQH
ncbi:hypothetical protein RHMOL_Rhmol04G0339000 [Rhododendron molle]|uniref:Uncharacterized protein n=1 Tax=Rhododendron molle TaxID=49168 RepID=A0ACC0P8R3_RHOML|nr:hypothetical protein RHMOL_Rhmol04G0339000 [Rhododendron molle]